MNEPEYKIVFLGEQDTGKTSIVNALTGRKLPKYYEATMGMSFHELHLQLNGHMIKLQIIDASGAEREIHFSLNFCKDAQLICLAIDASKSAKQQRETINKYKRRFLQAKINSSIKILVISNKADIARKILDEEDFASVGINRSQFISISASQIALDFKEGRPIALISKFAEMLKDVAPTPPRPSRPNQTCIFKTIFSCTWLSTLFSRPPPCERPHAQTTRNKISGLTPNQASTILNSIHRHLVHGASGDKTKPFLLGRFGGTRSGSFMFSYREVFFESEAKYPEHVMDWISMTAPCAANKLLNDEERSSLNLRSILKNLYNDIVKFTDAIPSSCTRSRETTNYYRELPGFIEGEINKILQSSNHHSPHLDVYPINVAPLCAD